MVSRALKTDRQPLPVRFKLLLLFFSVFISVLLAEAFVRVFAPQDLNGSSFEQIANGVYANKSHGESRGQHGARVVRYGFFPPHLRDTPVPSSGMRVLVVGDSLTFGALLHKEETYVSLLQSEVDREFGPGVFTLLNGGAGGWGTSDYVSFVREFGEEIRPTAVLVFISTDDIGRSLQRNNARPMNEECSSVRWINAKRFVAKDLINKVPGYQFLVEHSHALQLSRLSYLRLFDPGSVMSAKKKKAGSFDPQSAPLADASGAICLGRALFSDLKAWCDVHGVTLLVTTTGRHRPAEGLEATEPTRAFMKGAPLFFAGLSIPFFDYSPEYWALSEPERRKLILEGDSHPGPEGARFIATSVWGRFLKPQLRKLSETPLKASQKGIEELEGPR
jgi:lysophospholipase L1-like esterase